jgi:hypothetical protein
MIRKISILAIALAASFAVSSPADAQTAYRWKDKDGKVHYSDQPPPEGAAAAEVKNFSDNAADATPSWNIRQASENFPVVLYTSSNCTQLCQDARGLLQTRGAPFKEIILGSDEDIKEFNRIFGEGTGVPSATVGSATLKGFEAGAWTRQLDRAGYPKGSQ